VDVRRNLDEADLLHDSSQFDNDLEYFYIERKTSPPWVLLGNDEPFEEHIQLLGTDTKSSS
jgi:hypothetical protein